MIGRSFQELPVQSGDHRRRNSGQGEKGAIQDAKKRNTADEVHEGRKSATAYKCKGETSRPPGRARVLHARPEKKKAGSSAKKGQRARPIGGSAHSTSREDVTNAEAATTASKTRDEAGLGQTRRGIGATALQEES